MSVTFAKLTGTPFRKSVKSPTSTPVTGVEKAISRLFTGIVREPEDIAIVLNVANGDGIDAVQDTNA